MLRRTIELFAVDRRAAVIRFNNIAVARLYARPLFDHLVLKSAGGFFHAWLLGVVVQEFLAVRFIFLSDRLHFILLFGHRFLLFLHHLLLKRLQSVLHLIVG